MQVKSWNRFAALALAALLLMGARSWAAVPDIETFENDTDAYTPGSDPVNEPTSGSAPGSWKDQRNGGAGIIEEVPSGHLGIPTSAGGGSSYGIIYPANPTFELSYPTSNAPHGFPSFSTEPLGESWSYQADVYTDGSIVGNGNSVPDFWWTNAVNRIGADEYLTETGFTGEVQPNGEWRFTTTKGGLPSVDLAANTWYTLEVSYDTSGPLLSGSLNIYNQAHTALLYTHSLSPLFPENTPPASSELGGPRYSWFTYFEDNLDHLAVDNVGVGTPITLATSAVAGDMNANGVLDSADAEQFELALSNLSATQGTITMGDVNGDGAFNYFDIADFAALEGSGSSSGASLAAAVPEPSTLVLGIAGLIALAAVARRRGR